MNTFHTEDDTFRRLTRKSLEEMETLFRRHMGLVDPNRTTWREQLFMNGWTRKEWDNAHRPK
jgi:hypothetical protein